jgi:hypothetical protein
MNQLSAIIQLISLKARELVRCLCDCFSYVHFLLGSAKDHGFIVRDYCICLAIMEVWNHVELMT